jgi:hypothetical protein
MELKIAIHGENLHLRVLKEMLNHQGIIFEEFDEEKEYPCVISTIDRFKDINQNNVVLADEIVPMEEIIFALSGVLNNNFKEPEVNKYEFKLKEEIKKVFSEQNLPLIRKWFWPNFAKYCCVMTHDIDRLNIPPNSARKETPNLIKAIMHVVYYYQKYILRKKKFRDYIDLIIALENRYNVKSSFYFFQDYCDDEHEGFINVLNRLKKENFEVGLHSNSTSLEQLEREKQELEKNLNGKIVGTRQHTLKFSVPQTWQYQEKLLDYDLSFYRNEDFGFRAGLCFPYRPLNTSSIIEIPTSFMDWTALHKKMTYDQIKEELSKIFVQIENYNGCLVLNFHNEYFNKITFPHIYKTFIDILGYIQKDYWVTTARECVAWWKRRESAKIDLHIENNIIIGSSSDKIPLIVEYNGKSKSITVNDGFRMEL